MQNTTKKLSGGFIFFLRRIDLWLLAAAVALVAFGVQFIYSASVIWEGWHYGDRMFYVKHQVANASIGLVFMGAAAYYGRRVMLALSQRRVLWGMLAGAWVLLFAVLFMPATYGLHISIPAGFFKFSPAVFSAIVLLLFVAVQLGRQDKQLKSLGTIAAIAITLDLIILEGNASLPGVILLGIIFMYRKAGLRLRYIAALTASAGIIFLFEIIRYPYRVERLHQVLFPTSYPDTFGYITMVSRKLLSGAGAFGGISAAELRGFPSFHTDFAFTALAAVNGYLAAFVVVVLLGFIVVRGVSIAKIAGSQMEALLAWGIVFMFAGQSFLHLIKCFGVIGANSAGLPFISYGGSYLCANCIMIGALLCIAAGGKVEVRGGVPGRL